MQTTRISTLSLLVAACAAAPAHPADFPYPSAAQVRQVLEALPEEAYQAAPSITDRSFWEPLHSPEVVEAAESIAAEPVPEVLEEDYLHYSRTGQRRHFTGLRLQRRDNLTSLVLAECMEDQGRFLGAINEYIESYLRMPSWVDPAHDKKLKVFRGEVRGADLFAMENGMVLSAAYSVLRPRLSGDLAQSIRQEIDTRIVSPYLAECRRKDLTGTYSFWWLTSKHNWNAVCTAGAVYCALITSDSAEVRAEVVACGLNGLELYLDGFTGDGYCSEGMHYWVFGFGRYLFLGEVLKSYSSGAIDMLESPKVASIAEFPRNMELSRDRYPAYSDSKIADRPTIYCRLALARNFGEPFAWGDGERVSGPLWEVLLNNALEHPEAADTPERELRSWFEDAHVLVCRQESDDRPFYASIKAGHNGEFHNHNDVGSYVVLMDGLFLSVDPGPEFYTSRTFSENRYVSDLINSRGHSVPLVGGLLQPVGRQHRGRVVSRSFKPGKDSLGIDLSEAYGSPSLRSLIRSFEFNREGGFVAVTDTATFATPTTFGTAFITYEDFEIVSDNEVRFESQAGVLRVLVDTGGKPFSIRSTRIEEDAVFGEKPHRIGIDLQDPIKRASIELRYERGR